MTRETDIVERLRSCNTQHCDEAADEIERLRAALQYIASLPGADPITGSLAVTAARAALKGTS